MIKKGNLLMNVCRRVTLAGFILGIFEDQVRLNCKTVSLVCQHKHKMWKRKWMIVLKKATN